MKPKWMALVIIVLMVCGMLLASCALNDPFPLSKSGPYQYGQLNLLKTDERYIFNDAKREDRKVGITIWYPAILADGTKHINAEADESGAPYPMILCSAKLGGYFGAHMASQGFIVIGINGQDSTDHWGKWMLDYPRDMLFILNQISSTPLKGLEGKIDTDKVGSLGYSFDGFTALTLGGARIDPGFYQTQCATTATMNPKPADWWVDYICNMTGGWEAFVANAGSTLMTSTDGLWQPMTDERIKAVMPMAPEGAWLYGEKGLAAVDRPTLILDGTADDINYYDREAVYIFEHLGTNDKILISFIDKGHMMIYYEEPVLQMRHLATAFFGYYLQDKTEYQDYLTEKAINNTKILAWGVYSK
jgi:predicted dienelactone hydrolase